jgi:ribose 1,5-bisphosphokinase PhnN
MAVDDHVVVFTPGGDFVHRPREAAADLPRRVRLALLESRLRERKSDAPQEIARRLTRAVEEIAAWREYDYLIVNRHLDEAVRQLACIIEAERWRTSRLVLDIPDLPRQEA